MASCFFKPCTGFSVPKMGGYTCTRYAVCVFDMHSHVTFDWEAVRQKRCNVAMVSRICYTLSVVGMHAHAFNHHHQHTHSTTLERLTCTNADTYSPNIALAQVGWSGRTRTLMRPRLMSQVPMSLCCCLGSDCAGLSDAEILVDVFQHFY